METIKVLWFNQVKEYGEGQAADGRRIFLHASAMTKKIQDHRHFMQSRS